MNGYEKLLNYDRIARYLNVPITIHDKFNNAMYIKHNPNFNPNVKSGPSNDSVAEHIYRLASSPKGGIIAGTNLVNDTIMAHEIGHSQDDSFLSSIAPKTERLWGTYHIPLLTTLAAVAGSYAFPEYKNYIHGANIGINALSALPTLYSEYTANQKALEHANKLRLNVDSGKLNNLFTGYIKDQAEKKLFTPGISYATSLAVPIIGSYLSEKLK